MRVPISASTTSKRAATCAAIPSTTARTMLPRLVARLRPENDARASGSLQGDGSLSWGGAAGTWFWVDPQNDVIFVGMIQRMGGTGGDDLGTMARTLTYQALTHPEK